MVIRRDLLDAGDEFLDEGVVHELVHLSVDAIFDVGVFCGVADEGVEGLGSDGGVLGVGREIGRVDGLDGFGGSVAGVDGGHGGWRKERVGMERGGRDDL